MPFNHNLKMIPQTLKDKWQQSFDEAITNIECYMKPREWDTNNHYEIFKWLLTSDRMMIYGILPDDNKMGTVFDTDELFNALCHALYDDGDVSFLSLWRDTEPIEHKMAFVFRGDVLETDVYYFQNTLDMMQRHDTFICDDLNKPRPKYTVTAHRDPIKFIQDVETLHKHRDQSRTEKDAWLKQRFKQKPDNPSQQ